MKKICLAISALCMVVGLAACNKPEDLPVPSKPTQSGGEKPTVRNIYVSPEGEDTNNGFHHQFPLKTFTKVLSIVKPGDIVNIMPGTWERTSGTALLNLTPINSGEAGKPITFKAYDPDHKPVIYAHGDWGSTIKVNASYIIIDGIEIRGEAQDLSIDAAYDESESYVNNVKNGIKDNVNRIARYNTAGIGADGEGADKYIPHHVIIRNCVVHDMPGCGIGASNIDYVLIENNIVYNNCWTCAFANSGISVMHPVNSGIEDAEWMEKWSGHKVVISNNVCFNNVDYVPWYRPNSDKAKITFNPSDGNGIILDINNRSDYAGGPYTGRTLVCNNLSVYNGGSGIHAYGADHVDIINNTAFMNGRRYPKGEYADIYAHGDKDVTLVNNIMYARPGGDANKAGSKANSIIYENNVMYGGKQYTGADYFLNGKANTDPMFVITPSVTVTEDWTRGNFHPKVWQVDPSEWRNPKSTVVNFRLKSGSPAIGAGVKKDWMPALDQDGNERGSSIDSGAYQFVNN